MDRGSLGRLLLIAASVLLALTFLPKLFGGSSELQPLKPEGTLPASATRAPERLCDIWTEEFRAQLSTRSASLKHYELLRAKYQKHGEATVLGTTPDVEERRQLRFHFRNPAAGVKPDDWLVKADLLDYELTDSSAKSCSFAYRDERVAIEESIRTTGRPYELEVTTTIENLASRPLAYAATVHTDAWREQKEIHGGWLQASPLITHVECIAEDATATRLRPEDFSAKELKEISPSPLNLGDWREAPGVPAVGAVSNAYFSHALVPLAGPAKPVCQLQIEERWDHRRYPRLDADPHGGAMYRARLAYPKRELAPGAKDQFRVLSYIGPKERRTLDAAAGGNRGLSELIDLGFFSAIAKVLVSFLLKVHSVVPNWGIAIIVLTLTARTLLFPLTLPSIRSMIKMRELKPEIDALNEKFKDDPQAKGLAQMELWRKHNVNPLKGCLPQLASMPVWFALYTTLQTAVELYNIPFLWFPDLSERDPYFILPFVIGATSFVQTRLMPMQGDPMQQKMMLYFMPAMFVVMMLFLPSGLGVYMFTNGLLGIVQQQAVEWHARRSIKKPASDIKVEVVSDGNAGSNGEAGKGKKSGTKGAKNALAAKNSGTAAAAKSKPAGDTQDKARKP